MFLISRKCLGEISSLPNTIVTLQEQEQKCMINAEICENRGIRRSFEETSA